MDARSFHMLARCEQICAAVRFSQCSIIASISPSLIWATLALLTPVLLISSLRPDEADTTSIPRIATFAEVESADFDGARNHG